MLPTAITHAVVGVATGVAFSKRHVPKRFWALSIICAMLPDLDVITFRFGIPYGNFWGHRGFFHSLFFAMLLGIFISTVLFRDKGQFSKSWWFYSCYFSAVTATHGILDAFTNGGLGIALLSPFDNERYFFWATPILVSPLSLKAFLSERGIGVLKNEFIWVWLPAIEIAAIGRFSHWRKEFKKSG
jgi:inner membrane protein